MAIIALVGAEMGTFGEVSSVFGSTTISATHPNTGSYSYLFNPSGGSAYIQAFVSTAKRISIYIYIDTSPDVESRIIGSLDANMVNVRLTSDRYLKLYNQNTQKGSTGSIQLAEYTYYRISVSLDPDTANDPCKVYIDGVEEISADTDGCTIIQAIVGVASATADIYVDDIVLDDTASTADLGDIRVQLAQPNVAGDLANFDGDTGGETDHYKYYDDPAGGLDDNDYVIHEAKSVVQDIANLESCSEAGLGGSDTINAVRICYRWKLSKDGDDLPSVYVKDDGTGYATTVPRDSDDVWYWDFLLYTTMPDDSEPWTHERFDAFQVGMQSSGDAADLYLSCVMVMLAYTPVAAPAYIPRHSGTVGVLII